MYELSRFINDLINNFPWLCVLFTFILGAIVGSYLNVCIIRMPLEKSIFWPGSRCGNCLSAIRWYDNLPLISYWRLGGKCRACGVEYSSRYFWIEFLTGACFAFLFYLEVLENVRNIGQLWGGTSLNSIPQHPEYRIQAWQLLLVWFCHSILASLLLVATFTDIDHWEIPLGITIPGTLIGLVCGSLMPWPWPMNVEGIGRLWPMWQNFQFGGLGWPDEMTPLVPAGFQCWPFFLPTPEWAPAGSWQLGLATSLAGALVGNLGMRLIRWVFTWGLQKEAMGLGDADLMMMIGAFLGWQALIVTMIFAVALGVIYAVILLIRDQGNQLPFGPFLSGGGAIVICLPWYILIFLQKWLFALDLVLILAGVSLVLALCLTLSMRMIRLIFQAS
jgi:leader peptidase (prepilin peptidase)/N-methyltransferase